MTESLDDYVIAVSADALYSGRRIDATKSEVLIHGIPLQEYTYDESARASVREQLSIGSEEVVIGTVANFLPAKDYRNLITALAMLHGTGVDFSFVSVGHGPLMESMKQLADEVGLTPKMHFLGLQSNVARILSGLDVFALGSREEGLPIAVMEALACGIPIVATRVCMLPTQLQDLPCAILVEPRNPDQLASALSKVVTDGALRRSMSQAARIESTRFSHVRSTARLEEIYSRLVEASEPKRRGLRGAATKPPIDWSTE
jgi:glycosyltransferase involved in cell wall biosynthesis